MHYQALTCPDVQNEYNGLRQIKQYVFKRQRTSTTPNNTILNPTSSHAQQPTISSTGNISHEKASPPVEAPLTYSQGREQTSSSLVGTMPKVNTKTSQSSGGGIDKQPSIAANAEPRRFHLSRSSIRTPAGATPGSVQGSKGPPAIFIERRRVAQPDQRVSDTPNPRNFGPEPRITSKTHNKNGGGNAQMPSTQDQSRPPAPLRNVKLPSGMTVPWDADSATLAAQMQAYTMQEIGHNLSKASATETSTTSTPHIRARQVSGFRPKAPALRYHERHPEKAKAVDGNGGSNPDEIMTDAAEPDGDESGYVMDTYIRLPAEMFEFEEQKSVGLLVLDSQPDIDEFYNDESDSDSEIYDEEEDENGKSPQ